MSEGVSLWNDVCWLPKCKHIFISSDSDFYKYLFCNLISISSLLGVPLIRSLPFLTLHFLRTFYTPFYEYFIIMQQRLLRLSSEKKHDHRLLDPHHCNTIQFTQVKKEKWGQGKNESGERGNRQPYCMKIIIMYSIMHNNRKDKK